MSNIESFENAIKARESDAAMQMIADDPGLARKRLAGGLSPMMLAAYHGAWDLVRWFTECGYIHGLADAVISGDAELVSTMLSNNPATLNEYTADGFTPLHIAVFFGRDPIATLLIEHGANLNAVSQNELRNQPLQAAISGAAGDEVIELLIAKGADINADGYTPLHLASSNGRGQIVRLLLERGADPKRTTPDGKTAVDLATENGHSELVELLAGS